MTAAVEERVCANPRCDKPLVRRDKERPYSFARRVYCSSPCADAAGARGRKQAPLPPRSCARPGCSKRLVRRKLENLADWKARVYCSAVCNQERATPVSGRRATTVVEVPSGVAEVASVVEQTWMGLAACKTADPERFAPIEKEERAGLDRCRQAAAAFCRRCPVAGSCRRFAAETGQQGVWGAQLRQMRNGRIETEPLLGAPARRAS